MDWLTIVGSVVVLWIASLCKILQTAYSPSRATFLNSGSINRNVLLVIAHPDDESMFFTPIINYLASRGHNLHIFCMSTGNADGMGNVRKQELYKASAVLKFGCIRIWDLKFFRESSSLVHIADIAFQVSREQVKILDHPEFQDGFRKVWNHDLLASIIKEEVQSHGIDLIITFDNFGVSGHCNHRDVYYGTRKLLHDNAAGNIEAWELVSTNIFRKYSGPADIWLSIIHAMFYPKGEVQCLLNEQPLKSYNAMAQHASQWVWFRKLFVVLSSYTYVNTLKKMTY